MCSLGLLTSIHGCEGRIQQGILNNSQTVAKIITWMPF